MNTDLATIDRPAPTPIGKTKQPLRVKGKLVVALRAIVREGQELDEAARTAGMTTQAVRQALEKPHVLTFLKHEREVFRAYVSAQNIHHARKIRNDAGNAMAQLGAMKFIEQIDEQEQRAGSRSSAPGVVIVIGDKSVSVTAHERSIDANPLIQHTSGRDKPGQLANDALHHDPLKGPGGG